MRRNAARIATVALAAVWLGNGLLAKVLGFVPRHEEIVARFFGDAHARGIVVAIGLGEIAMAAWIVSGYRRRRCALAQATLVVAMNGLELWRARDLLLFPVLMPVANALLIALAFVWSSGDCVTRGGAARTEAAPCDS
jgi:hypothetical protein